MSDIFTNLLYTINIILPYFVALLYVNTRKAHNYKETVYAVFSLIFWSSRYIWFLIRELGLTSELTNRLIGMILVFLLLFPLLWIKELFTYHNNAKSKINSVTEYLHNFALFVLILLVPISLIVPPDMVNNDANYVLRIILLFVAILFFLIVTLGPYLSFGR